MKYPNDFTRERNGYARGSQGDRDALARVNTPFLTKESPGSRTYKKNGFYESEVFVGEPSLIGLYKLNSAAIFPAAIDIDDDESGRITKLTPFYLLGTLAANPTLARLPYVGDGFVLALFSNLNDIGADTDAVTHWPVMMQALSWAQYLASDPERMGRSTTFIDDIQISGLLTDLHTFYFTCSGWDDDTKRYRFGLAATYWTGSPHVDNRVPIFYVGDTGTQTMTQVAPVYSAGRNNIAFAPFVIGLGRLQGIHVVEEDDTLVLPKVAPYLVNSTDHGDTWASAAAAFLTTYLFEYPIDGPDRAYYENLQLTGLAFSSLIVYLGQGKSLLIISNGFKDMMGDPMDTPPDARFGPMAFLGTDGAGYARITWPPDDWFTSSNGASLGGDYLRFFGYTNDLRTCQFGFGDGCMYMPVRRDGTDNKIMFTRDYGSTWNFSGVLPGRMNDNNLSNFGAVIEPYVDADNKGKIVFAVPDYDLDKLVFFSTDGDFTEFKQVTSLKPPGNGLDETADPDFNVFFTNFGGARKPYVFPAFPGEFDQP